MAEKTGTGSGKGKPAERRPGGKGFRQAGTLVAKDIRRAGERRGFAETRLLTDWAEIAGPETAAIARPVRVSYREGGFGATLTLLVQGARAAEVEMGLPALRERINACYGYNAISRIRITQTAATGFGEEAAPFAAAQHAPVSAPALTAEEKIALSALVGDVGDDGLRTALLRLGSAVRTRRKS